jgi:hypothetical protein
MTIFRSTILAAACGVCLMGAAQAGSPPSSPETAQAEWCTSDKTQADNKHVYDPACPSSSARMGDDGTWHPQSPPAGAIGSDADSGSSNTSVDGYKADSAAKLGGTTHP